MKILASWDDGCAEDMRLADLMNKYEVDSIFYVPSEWQSYNLAEGRAPLSLEELHTLDKRFHIGSHGVTHRMLTRIPAEDVAHEIVDSQKSLEHLLGHPIASFCYPRGYANDHIRDIVRDHYATARNTLVGNVKKAEDAAWITPTVHVCGKRRPEYENTTWLKEAYRLLEEAIKTPDSVYHIWGHSWEISRYDGWHELEELLKGLAAL